MPEADPSSLCCPSSLCRPAASEAAATVAGLDGGRFVVVRLRCEAGGRAGATKGLRSTERRDCDPVVSSTADEVCTTAGAFEIGARGTPGSLKLGSELMRVPEWKRVR